MKQINGFLIKTRTDHRIGPNHLAIYMALFEQWCVEGTNPICVAQSQIRQVAKIGRTTYHKCMHELHAYGYIRYTPSNSPTLGSLVEIVVLEAVNKDLSSVWVKPERGFVSFKQSV